MMYHLIFADLVRRWPAYTKRGLQKLKKRDAEFPQPFFSTPTGRGNKWRVQDILAYEEMRPELLDQTMKKRKVARFALAVFKKRAGG
jgi:hypothetical protein